MGARAIVAVVVVAVAIAIAALVLVGGGDEIPGTRASSESTSSRPIPARTTHVPPMEPAESADAAAPPPSEPVASPVVAAEAGGKDAILAAIQEAAITYDPTSLPAIAPHLGSQDPVVRAAAVDGIMLLGDAAGAPLLRRAADRSANAAESASLKAKAAYLELPPGKLLTPKKLEALRTRKAAGKAAAGQNP